MQLNLSIEWPHSTFRLFYCVCEILHGYDFILLSTLEKCVYNSSVSIYNFGDRSFFICFLPFRLAIRFHLVAVVAIVIRVCCNRMRSYFFLWIRRLRIHWTVSFCKRRLLVCKCNKPSQPTIWQIEKEKKKSLKSKIIRRRRTKKRTSRDFIFNKYECGSK